jgi:hypothetical protein
MIESFTPKRTNEREVFSFDLVNVLAADEQIVSVTFSISIKSYPTTIDAAANNAAAAMVTGPSSINFGTVVSQTIQGGTDQAYYYLTADIITSRQTFEAVGIISIDNGGA